MDFDYDKNRVNLLNLSEKEIIELDKAFNLLFKYKILKIREQ